MTSFRQPRGRWYVLDQKQLRYSAAGFRPSKLAAGMQFTAARVGSKQAIASSNLDALTLALRGTLDPLARTNRMKEYRKLHYRQEMRWVKKR